MKQKRIAFMIVLLAVGLITVSAYLMSAAPANAQCGSQASSCKNCHETQAQDPVNGDGTAWHTQHAFGDFCYLCHAGNNQATDEAAAHTGLVPPLSDVVTNCRSCHPSDYEAQAKVYAASLGVEIGTGSGTSSSSPAAPSSPSSNDAASDVPAVTVLDVDDPNLVNFTQRYSEIVLGKKPVNWGNVILLLMIAMFAIGGGAFALHNEKLIKVVFGETKKVEGEYPSDVVEMLPVLVKLKPQVRKSLKGVLEDPKKTTRLLDLVEVVTDTQANSETKE